MFMSFIPWILFSNKRAFVVACMIILHCAWLKKMQVLTNGIEVKLQRNALSVIEAPTGNEEDDDLENTQWNGSDMGECQFRVLWLFFPIFPIFFLFKLVFLEIISEFVKVIRLLFVLHVN